MIFTRLSVAFTVSSALAAAIPDAFPLPEAFAMAVPADGVCSTSDCHAVCGPMIVAARACSENTNSPDAGPWDTECLCPTDSAFMANYEACMGCGQSLWQIYGRFLTSPLGACQSLVTSPTGNVTPCDSSSAPASSVSSSADPISSDPTSSAPVSSAPVSSDAVSSAAVSSAAASSAAVSSAAASSAAVSSAAASSAAVSSATVSSDPASSFEPSSVPASASIESTDSSAESTLASVTSSSSVAGNGTITSTITQDEESTTVITVTSCDEEKCIETPVVTGVTVITKTHNGVVTEYTTYCPVTGTTYAKGVPSTVSKKTETTSTDKTTGKSTVQSSVGTTSVVGATATTAVSTSHVISTFEGKAGSLVIGTVGVLFGLMLL